MINNLEIYGIDLKEFAKDCQHGVAASTSIANVPGRKTPQLLIQGNQVAFVGKLLSGNFFSKIYFNLKIYLLFDICSTLY